MEGKIETGQDKWRESGMEKGIDPEGSADTILLGQRLSIFCRLSRARDVFKPRLCAPAEREGNDAEREQH
jgi:hypothetical protein